MQRRQLALQLRRHRAAVDTVAPATETTVSTAAVPPAMRPTFFTSSLRRVFTAAGSFLPGRGATSSFDMGQFFQSCFYHTLLYPGGPGRRVFLLLLYPTGRRLASTDRPGTAAHTLDCGHDPRN